MRNKRKAEKQKIWKNRKEGKSRKAEKERSKEAEKQENAEKQRSKPAGKSGDAKKQGKAEKLGPRNPEKNQNGRKKTKTIPPLVTGVSGVFKVFFGWLKVYLLFI